MREVSGCGGDVVLKSEGIEKRGGIICHRFKTIAKPLAREQNIEPQGNRGGREREGEKGEGCGKVGS